MMSIASTTGKTVDLGTRTVTLETARTRLHPKRAIAAVMTATSIALPAVTVTASIVASDTGGSTEADRLRERMALVT